MSEQEGSDEGFRIEEFDIIDQGTPEYFRLMGEFIFVQLKIEELVDVALLGAIENVAYAEIIFGGMQHMRRFEMLRKLLQYQLPDSEYKAKFGELR